MPIALGIAGFSVVAALLAMAILLRVRETRGMRLEEIDAGLAE